MALMVGGGVVGGGFAVQGQVGPASGGPFGAAPQVGHQTDPVELVRMVAMRMRWEHRPFHHPGIDYFHAYHGKGTQTVIVLVVKNGKPVVFEEEFGLFPSDTFVTQLRTLAGNSA